MLVRLAVALALPLVVAAQEPQPAQPAPAQTIPAQTPPAPEPAPPPAPEPAVNPQPSLPNRPARIVVTGLVLVEGRHPLPAPAEIRAGCNGRIESILQAMGRFSVVLGQAHYTDGRPNALALTACEIQATLSGYQPAVATINAANSSGQESAVLILRRRDDIAGFTYSITNALASPEAKKAYERGLDRVKGGKLDEARREFEKAVGLYPKYAAAWFELGVIHHRHQRIDDARSAYRQSLTADDRFLKPALQLAMIAAAERNWAETLSTTARIVSLNPIDFPQAYLYHAVASFNLGDRAVAEKSVRRAIDLDANHQLPKARHLLGIILADRGALPEAAENLRAYLKHAPKAPDFEQVRRMLDEIERNAGKPNTPSQFTGSE